MTRVRPHREARNEDRLGARAAKAEEEWRAKSPDLKVAKVSASTRVKARERSLDEQDDDGNVGHEWLSASDTALPRPRRRDVPRGFSLDGEPEKPARAAPSDYQYLSPDVLDDDGTEPMSPDVRLAAHRIAMAFDAAAKIGQAPDRLRRAIDLAICELYGAPEHVWIGALMPWIKGAYLRRVEAERNGRSYEADAEKIIAEVRRELDRLAIPDSEVAAPDPGPEIRTRGGDYTVVEGTMVVVVPGARATMPRWVTPELVSWTLHRFTMGRGGGISRSLSATRMETLLRSPEKLAAEIDRDARRVKGRDARRLEELAAEIRNSGG